MRAISRSVDIKLLKITLPLDAVLNSKMRLMIILHSEH
jgi:hypothetical protein